MTGRDVLAVRHHIEGDFVIIPNVAFKSDEPIMLDRMAVGELQTQLGLPLRALDFDGFAKLFD